MIDTHNLLLENFDPIKIINENFEMIDHIHISEYKLTALKNKKFHIEFSNNLKNLNYSGMIIFEIFKNPNILNDINKFINIYN
jgi:sugar phosphate isomerase/epimerase